jgi:hypothetical protein
VDNFVDNLWISVDNFFKKLGFDENFGFQTSKFSLGSIHTDPMVTKKRLTNALLSKHQSIKSQSSKAHHIKA